MAPILSISSLFCLFFLLFTTTSTESKIIVAVNENLNDFDYDLVVSSFDVRAVTARATFVVLDSESDIPSLAGAFKSSESADVKVIPVSIYVDMVDYIVVFGKGLKDLKLEETFGTASVTRIFGDAAVLFKAVLGTGMEQSLESLVDRHSDVVMAYTFPKRGLAPRRSFLFTPIIEKKASIIELINQVSASNLESNVTILANDFGNPNSRNSVADGLDEAQVYVSNYFSSLGLTVTTHQHQPNHALNTIATKIGNGQAPRQRVIIGAHLDSRNAGSTDTSRPAPGSDDNASGSSAVLEAARIVQVTGTVFEHDLVFALWTGEEQGLLGSRSYASELDDENAPVLAYINVDMIGYRVNANSILSLMTGSSTVSLNQQIRAVCAEYLPSLEIGSTGACCSDQQSFYENGFPSASFFEHEDGAGSYPCYHQQCDTPDQLDYEMLAENTQCFLAAAAYLANPLN